MNLNKSLLFLFIVLLTHSLFGQNDYEKKYIQLTPGEQYKAGWLHELILGKHWRDLWTTPINVEILDLNKFAGGLTPLKKGGGFQTKSLRLTGKDGNIWKFRSMAKDPAKVLPKILRKTFVADVFQDQISSANPLAALVAAPILTAVNILQAKPYLVYMPDDPKLNEFREEFGGLVGMIEIHPDVDEDIKREFEGADKIKSTFKLLDILAEKRTNRINSKEYLKARLVDIFLGDWDRHTDQWKWAKYKNGDLSLWSPIPRDRDQVFAKWDGIGPSIAEYIVPQFVHFDYDYPKIEFITWSGRHIDRRFLTELTKVEWDSITIDLVSKLTDEVIEDAVGHLPREHYYLASEELISKLKSRKLLLKKSSDEFYNLINDVVDIYGSNKDDIAEVSRINNLQTRVQISYIKKKNNKRIITYNKIFDNSITNEFRIYLLEGKDSIIVNGEVDSSPLVRVVGGKGKDSFVDQSRVNGFLIGLLPIPNSEIKTEFYDSGKKTKVKDNGSTYFNNWKTINPKDVYEKYEPKIRNRGSKWWPSPVLSFNSNDGLRIGMGAQYYKYNFRMDPFEFWMNFTADYATKPGSISLNFNGIYNSLIKGSTVTLDIQRSELLFTNYYGFGNETVYDEKLDDIGYYRIHEDLFNVRSAIHLNYFEKISGSIGFDYKYSELELNNENLIKDFQNEYGLHGFKLLQLDANFRYDSRDGIYFPKNGVYFNLKTAFYPKVLDVEKEFYKIESNVNLYTSFNILTDFTFALKAGGGKVFGKHPFFESIFLGGGVDLRGYTRRRFAGDASIYGKLELRTYLLPVNIIVPGKIGVHGFEESGRVFESEEVKSEIWHQSYGGGVWLTFIENAISASFSIAKSSETTEYYFSLGMGF